MRKIPALRALTELLGRAPPVAAWSTRHTSCITERWSHPALHGAVPALAENVVAVWFSGTGAIEHRHGHSTLLGHAAAGAVCVVPEGEASWIGTSVPFDGVHVLVSTEHLRAVAHAAGHAEPRLRACVAEPDPLIFPLVEMALRAAGDAEPASQLMLELALDMICAQLLRCHQRVADDASPQERPRHTQLDDERLQRIDVYINGNLASALTIDELAGVAGLSRSHFCTAFRHARGVTPHDYLTGRRVAEAKNLLADRAVSVAEVAARVGFRTTSAFCAIFKRATGTTPTQFRRHRGQHA